MHHADVSGEKNPNYGKGFFGESNPNWQGGKKRNFYRCGNQPGVARKEDREFRRRIIDRDGSCILCRNTSRLLVHHIEPWVEREDLRFDEKNCLSLCIRCHARADNVHHKEATKPMLIAYIKSIYP
jgi:5-methylcytosine-specific restriction endonuclease McrA